MSLEELALRAQLRTMGLDPNVSLDRQDVDPEEFPWSGVAIQGNTPFNTTLITKIVPHMYQGGVIRGFPLPDKFTHVISLYPWASYRSGASVLTVKAVMADDSGQDFSIIDPLARLVVTLMTQGKDVLVHCEAGLNRSSLVVARALMLDSHHMSALEAVDQIRARRSPACLCNPEFEKWVLSHDE